MIRRASYGVLLALLVVGVTPAAAQDQGFSLSLGGFSPLGEDGRVEGDVLNANRCIDVSFFCEPLLFDVGDFRSFSVNGEYFVGLGEFVEASVGVGISQRTVPSLYEFVTRPDGTEIEQDLKLRLVPVTGIVRFIPTGRSAGLQPYIGGGITAIRWRYSESGEFVDTFDNSIFRATFTDEGTEVGPVVVGGLRGPVGTNFLLGGEVRYQRADAELQEDDFLGDRIDLGGFSYLATLTWRF